MALTFRFGVSESYVRVSPEGGLTVGVACPVADAASEEVWPVGAATAPAHVGDDGWAWARTAHFAVGAVTVRVTDATLEAETRRLYAALLAANSGRHLYRIWHFVPRIIETPAGELENYQKFCRARACAFESAYALAPELRMPAASAVGVDGDRLVIVALAGEVAPEHFENPEQVPAYRYPERYGPKSPSFARATRVVFPGETWTFVSGTAAIKGSESVCAGDAAGQARVTADNLRLMCAFAGGLAARDRVVARGYLRAGVTPEAARAALPGAAREHAIVVRADICRRELLLECEWSAVRFHS